MKQVFKRSGRTIALLVLLFIVAVVSAGVYGHRKSKQQRAGELSSQPQAKADPDQSSSAHNPSRPDPSSSDPRDLQLRQTLALIDGVGFYSKHGRIENYGADIRQRRGAAIGVKETELHRTGDALYLVWYPDFSPAAGARFLEITFSEALPPDGRVTAGLELATGEIVSFRHDFGSSPVSGTFAARKLLPAELSSMIEKATVNPMQLRGRQLVGTLPDNLATQLAKGKNADTLIRTWFVSFEGVSSQIVRLSSVSLAMAATEAGAGGSIALSGQTRGLSSQPGRQVELVSEDGKRVRQTLSLDGTFSFSGLVPGRPVSLRINHDHQDYFATNGRWFVPWQDRNDIVIDFNPRYSNPSAQEPNPKRARFQSTGSVEIIEEYQPHTRQIWNGYGGYPQEYDNITFANNIGHIDRDRLYDNADNCYRILAFGASLSVAIQVPLFEKFNAILEEELGIALQRCVEVISLGRNNGDIGANYPRLKKYGPLFKPDMLLFENSAGVMFQLQPDLVRKLLGYDFDKSPLDHFSRTKAGALEFVPLNPGWAVFSSPPNTAPLQKNVPFMESFSVPPRRMSREAQEAYRMLSDIYGLYKKQYPQSSLALFSALEQAKCRGKCWSEIQLESGETVSLGAPAFLRNLTEYCAQQAMLCFNPAIPEDTNADAGNYLTWKNDSHLNVRGHQWLARELSRMVHDHLRKR